MAKNDCVVYHVVLGENSGWNVKQINTGKVLGKHTTRTQAILQARDLALSEVYSLLVVFDREGKVEKEYNYGRRPG